MAVSETSATKPSEKENEVNSSTRSIRWRTKYSEGQSPLEHSSHESPTLSPDTASSYVSLSGIEEGNGSLLQKDMERSISARREENLHYQKRSPSERSCLLIPDDAPGDTGFRRESRRVYDTADGATDPLLSGERAVSRETGTGPVQARKAWGVLSKKVASGELLLRSSFVAGGGRGGNEDVSERAREEKLKSFRDGFVFSTSHCVCAIAVYLGLAVLAFSVIFDHWTIIDSMYFAVVTFTTIGYGDLTPDSNSGRVFTALFALGGVACLGIALGVIGDSIILAHKKAAEQSSKITKNQVVTLFSSSYKRADHVIESTSEEEHHAQVPPFSKQSSSRHILTELAATLVFVAFFVVLVNNDPGIDAKNVGDFFYFAIITACTVGYGDFAPTSQLGRGMSIVFIPLAVGVMGHFLSIVANWIIDGRQKRFRDQLADRDLTLQDLEVMDSDGDGNVTRAEFMEFMLVAMNKVDQELIDELKENFQKLDIDGSGSLSRDDLIAVAKKKLQSSTRKLELAAYKESLLRKASMETLRRQRRSNRSSFWSPGDQSLVESSQELQDDYRDDET